MKYEGPCYGCKDDNDGMKHPIDARQFKGGHVPLRSRCCGGFPLGLPNDIDAMIKAREQRIINEYKVCIFFISCVVCW